MSIYHDIKDNYGGQYDHCDFRPRKYKCVFCNKGFKSEKSKGDHEKFVHRVKLSGKTITEFDNRIEARITWNKMNKAWREESLYNKGEKYTLHKEYK